MKKIGFIGDSITAGVGASSPDKKWATLLCRMLDAEEQNLAISGSVTCRSPRHYCERERLDELLPCDMIFVALGINDWQVATKDGKTIISPKDAVPGATYCGPGEPGSKDESDMYGAFGKMCEKIKQIKAEKPGFENTRVIFLTPLVMAENPCQGNEKFRYAKDLKNIFGKTIKDYCDIISSVATKNGFEVIDTHELAGIYYNGEDDTTADEFLNDALHPNDKGHRRLAETVAKYL